MTSILKHELNLYYHSLTAYIFGAFLLLFTGAGALVYNINYSVANFEYVLQFITIVFIIIVPILTMRIIAEEKKQRTDQLLYSLPLSSTDVVLGKFFALMVIFAIPMAIICFYPLFFKLFGDVYLVTSYSALLAYFLLGAALISIGILISSLTESQGVAAGVCAVVMLVNYYSASLANYASSSVVGSVILMVVILLLLAVIVRAITRSWMAGLIAALVLGLVFAVLALAGGLTLEGLLPEVMHRVSLFERFQSFVNGVFDVTAIIYYISVTVFFLFLTVQAMEKRRYAG